MTPPNSWPRDIFRATLIVVCAGVIGLGVNAFSSRPVALLDPNGPGALPERAPRILVADLKKLLDERAIVFLADVRNAETIPYGSPMKSVNLPAHEFLDRYSRLELKAQFDAAEHIVVMCDSADCPAGDRVAKLLKDLRHENVRVLQGGWVEYKKAGLPMRGVAPTLDNPKPQPPG